jgi:adenosylcobinamide kinase/adenosylcobinamide-phosphate guanylyltransferase
VRTLITGGARSGKSRLAENLAGTGPVRYIAPGYRPGDDAEWAARVAAHRARRPATWETVETIEVAAVLENAEPGDVLLIDCLATWLTRHLDEAGAWTETLDWASRVDTETDRLVSAWRATTATAIAVTNEVGLGVVPATPAGRMFRDRLGLVNQQIGAASERLYLVVAGRALDLSSARAV